MSQTHTKLYFTISEFVSRMIFIKEVHSKKSVIISNWVDNQKIDLKKMKSTLVLLSS